MGPGLELQVTAMRVAGIVRRQGTIDVARMGVVALDQVRVVAVHRAHEIGDRPPHDRMQLGRQFAGLAGQVEGQVLEHGRALGRHERLGGSGGHGRPRTMRIMAGFMAGILLF